MPDIMDQVDRASDIGSGSERGAVMSVRERREPRATTIAPDPAPTRPQAGPTSPPSDDTPPPLPPDPDAEERTAEEIVERDHPLA